MAEVVVFTRPTCKFCQKAKDLLLDKNLAEMELIQIVLDEQDNYDEARSEMVRLADGKTTVPQIFINGKFIPGGFTGLKELDDNGQLDPMLQKLPTDESSGKFANRLNLKTSRVMRVQDMDF